MIWRAMKDAPSDDRELLLYFRSHDELMVGRKVEDGYWCATMQTGGELLSPDLWAEIEHPEGSQ